MKKFCVLMFLLMLIFDNQTLKANDNQYTPFKGYGSEQTGTPLPSSENNAFVKSNEAIDKVKLPGNETNPFRKSNEAFNGGKTLSSREIDPFDTNSTNRFKKSAQLRGDLDEDDFEEGADEDEPCSYNDPCLVGNGVWVLLLLAAAYGVLVFKRKQITQKSGITPLPPFKKGGSVEYRNAG
ncbi:MAG: hypothetical protein LBN95_10190 [Prevotellaceae bacterium]|jgi:hypothetical protein|nr:hypothetical protein [Prevotellaceae bacterium]